MHGNHLEKINKYSNSAAKVPCFQGSALLGLAGTGRTALENHSLAGLPAYCGAFS